MCSACVRFDPTVETVKSRKIEENRFQQWIRFNSIIMPGIIMPISSHYTIARSLTGSDPMCVFFFFLFVR